MCNKSLGPSAVSLRSTLMTSHPANILHQLQVMSYLLTPHLSLLSLFLVQYAQVVCTLLLILL